MCNLRPVLLYLSSITCLQFYLMRPTGAYNSYSSQQSLDSLASAARSWRLQLPEAVQEVPNQYRNNLRQPFEYMVKVPSYQSSFNNRNNANSYADFPGRSQNEHSYYDDLKLVENFASYLKETSHRHLDGEPDDANRQFNALLFVLQGLGKEIRNSCSNDFDKFFHFNRVYDLTYKSIVERYYQQGLQYADKVGPMVDDYIQIGKSRIAKIIQLQQWECELEQDCSESVGQKLEASSLLYANELEALESIASLARSFFSFADEFNQAAQRGVVLQYLLDNKDRLREYVMHVFNALEHLDDQPVKCK